MKDSARRAIAIAAVPVILAACIAASAQTPSGAVPQTLGSDAASAGKKAAAFTAPGTEASAATTAAIPDVTVVPKAALPSGDLGAMKHVWQSINNCGPAAVVMALSTLGVDTSQETARLALRGTDERRGMGPQGVGPWVDSLFGLKSTWRNNGTVELLKRLVSNGFAPMVTQWMVDPWVSRTSHWRTVRAYDDPKGVFYVNDSMLGNRVALSYAWFAQNWQPFSYRYMVIYKPSDEPLLRAILSDQWSDRQMRESYYVRAKAEAQRQGTSAAWLAFGEAAYQWGMFEESVAAVEKGLGLGSATGVFMLRSSLPNALRALGRFAEADAAQASLSNITPGVAAAAGPTTFTLDLTIAAIVAERKQAARDAALAERRLRLKGALGVGP